MNNRTNTIKQQSRMLLLAAVMFLGTGAAWGQAEKLVGSWVRVSKAQVAYANFELLSDGTGKSDGSPITWKFEKEADYIVFTKTVKGKETSVDYSPDILDNGDIYLRPFNRKEGSISMKEAYYQRKEKVDEIAQIKKDAKASAGSFTDSRDKKKYKSVKIAGKTWMAENLNFKADGSMCYGKKDANCTKYGRLYTYPVAKTACPEGWRLPKKEEAESLFKTSEKVANWDAEDKSAAIKSKTGWPSKLNGTNDLLFSALPGGSYEGDDFNGILGKTDGSSYWWLDLEKGEEAHAMYISSQVWVRGAPGFFSVDPETELGADKSLPKVSGLSVRCVQN